MRYPAPERTPQYAVAPGRAGNGNFVSSTNHSVRPADVGAGSTIDARANAAPTAPSSNLFMPQTPERTARSPATVPAVESGLPRVFAAGSSACTIADTHSSRHANVVGPRD